MRHKGILRNQWFWYPCIRKDFRKSLPVHNSRLKEKLLNKMPGLKAHTKGRDLLLISEKGIGSTIALACDYSDNIHMAKTAEILREDLQKHKSKFMGSFSADEIQSSISSSWLHLVKMIEHGPDIKSQLENDRCKSDLTIAHLLMFNYHPNITKRAVQQRHSLERETPFCVYLGLLIYAKTRKKQLIDILFQYGLCISYNRVFEISTQLGEAAVERFVSEGVVCPPKFRQGVLTTAAVDNIDHNIKIFFSWDRYINISTSC